MSKVTEAMERLEADTRQPEVIRDCNLHASYIVVDRPDVLTLIAAVKAGQAVKEFAIAMVEYFSESTEMDGADFQEMGVKHGIFEERPATQADIDEYDYNEYDVEVGDTIYVPTALLSEPDESEDK